MVVIVYHVLSRKPNYCLDIALKGDFLNCLA